MSKELKRLRNELAVIMDKINDIESQKRVAENRANVGKCFKCKNSYSGGDWWWLYRRITRIDEDGYMACVSFETRSDGYIEFSEREREYLSGEHIEITRKEFDEALANAIRSASAMFNGAE